MFPDLRCSQLINFFSVLLADILLGVKVHRISRVRSGGQAGAETSWETPACYGNRALLQVSPNTVSQHGFELHQVNRFCLFIQCMFQMWFVLCHHNQCKFNGLSP